MSYSHHFTPIALSFLSLCSLAGCSGHQMDGKDIDLPYQRPGRFLKDAAPAEAREAQKLARQESQKTPQERTQEAQKRNTLSSPNERYEMIPPEYSGGGKAGPIVTKDGHVITPQTNVTYDSGAKAQDNPRQNTQQNTPENMTPQ